MLWQFLKRLSQQTALRRSHRKAYACIHVAKLEKPVLHVVHDEDGDWQFLCGEAHIADEGCVVGIGHMFAIDATLLELSDLPQASEAIRVDVNSPWLRV